MSIRDFFIHNDKKIKIRAANLCRLLTPCPIKPRRIGKYAGLYGESGIFSTPFVVLNKAGVFCF